MVLLSVTSSVWLKLVRGGTRTGRLGRRSSFEQAPGFAGHHQLFVGGNHHHLHPRSGRADDGFLPLGLMVLDRVERDAELVEVAANGGAQFGGVFADAGGKHQRVRAVELREAGADPMTGRSEEHTSEL